MIAEPTLESLRDQRGSIERLAKRYGISDIRVFGSVARGAARADSDLDLLVQMEGGRSLFDHIAFMQDLEELLGRKVDVVEESALHWLIRDRVLSEAVPL